MENNLPGIPKFLNFFNLRECLAVCFSKHESPFGHLAAWVRVKQIIKVEPELGQSEFCYIYVKILTGPCVDGIRGSLSGS